MVNVAPIQSSAERVRVTYLKTPTATGKMVLSDNGVRVGLRKHRPLDGRRDGFQKRRLCAIIGKRILAGSLENLPSGTAQIILVGMPEPNWNELHDAYGSAEDLPDLLTELEPDPKAPVWGELWDRVCHQGSTFTASPHVLPFLLAAAADWEPRGRAMPLVLAACIVAAPETNPEGYDLCVAELRQLALETLASSVLSRSDRVYIVRSVLAFEGDRLWGVVFDRLNDGEFSGPCPHCNADLCLVIGQYGFFCSAGDWVSDSAAPRTDIHARKEGELPEAGRKLNGLCSADPTLTDWICHLFGTTTCPECSEALDVANVIAAWETPPQTGNRR